MFDSASKVREFSFTITTAVRFLPRVSSVSRQIVKNSFILCKRLINSPHMTFELESDDKAAITVLAFVRLFPAVSKNQRRSVRAPFNCSCHSPSHMNFKSVSILVTVATNFANVKFLRVVALLFLIPLQPGCSCSCTFSFGFWRLRFDFSW